MNELFLNKKDTLHVGQRWFSYNYPADSVHLGMSPPIVLAH